MARPRVFVSSTYYDLKHIRASLDLFIASLGFDSVLSEKGDIAFVPSIPLDESCYREAAAADIFVLIIGSRYGARSTADATESDSPTFFDRYKSITRSEFTSALDNGIPIYILIEKSVYAEYITYTKNKASKDIHYAHVESVNVFYLIEEIHSLRKNNPIHTFDRYDDIQQWLREQWSGLFRDLLMRQAQQAPLSNLAAQVNELKEVTNTLKTYMETIMKAPGDTELQKVIVEQDARLREALTRDRTERNQFVRYALNVLNIPVDDIVPIVTESASLLEILSRVRERTDASGRPPEPIARVILGHSRARADVNEIRAMHGLPPLEQTDSDRGAIADITGSRPEGAVYGKSSALDRAGWSSTSREGAEAPDSRPAVASAGTAIVVVPTPVTDAQKKQSVRDTGGTSNTAQAAKRDGRSMVGRGDAKVETKRAKPISKQEKPKPRTNAKPKPRTKAKPKPRTR